jgi:acetyl coenzyme A synthetase (ADP forming)-like protein
VVTTSQPINIEQMKRIFRPRGVAVIGASTRPGAIGYAVVENLKNGGFTGHVYPVNNRAEPGQELLGYPMYKDIGSCPPDTDVAVIAVPAALVPGLVPDIAKRGVAGMIVISSGFSETGNVDLQKQLHDAARQHNVRVMGPNIYGYYYTPMKLCATFCTPYTEQGGVALVSQSGGVGMAILGYSRSKKMGVSAIVGLGNKSDIDEDDLLEFFGQDDNTKVVAIHMEDLKNGRAFLETAKRVAKKKPVVVLKAGRTSSGARAAASHTAALAGQDQVYGAAFKQAGVIRARTLEDLLDWARVLQMLPEPTGENVVVITGAGGLGVLLSDACEDFGLNLMKMPKDLDEAFRKFIPPFGAAGNPVDITGGEPPATYENCIRMAIREPRINSLIIGYWHTIITPPNVFAELLAKVVKEEAANGFKKPVVATLAGDVQVEDACRYLEERGIPAYPYAPEKAVSALGAVYQFWRHKNA